MPSLPYYNYEFASFKLYDKTIVEGLVDHGHGPCQNAKKSSDLWTKITLWRNMFSNIDFDTWM